MIFMSFDLSKLTHQLSPVMIEAGKKILDVFHKPIDVRHKQDHSPVTLADEQAEAIIKKRLAEITPNIPVIAEEGFAAGEKADTSQTYYYLVDPLDGTREFVNKRNGFTVNIALMENHQPIFGMIYQPTEDLLYYGMQGGGAWKVTSLAEGGHTQPILASATATEPLRIVASLSHLSEETKTFLNRFPNAELVHMGSSLKLCLVAEGKADLYPRFGTTMEWDTAAGQAIVEAAGGQVLDEHLQRFSYGKNGLKNGTFYVIGDDALKRHLT